MKAKAFCTCIPGSQEIDRTNDAFAKLTKRKYYFKLSCLLTLIFIEHLGGINIIMNSVFLY